MVQEVRTLSSLEDVNVLRPVALQAMNDFARNTSNLFRCVMDPLLNSQALREMHFMYGPDQANTMGQFIEMANPAGPGANYIDTKRRQTAILAVRFAKMESKPRHPAGNGNHYNDRNDHRPVVQAYCPKCQNSNVKHTMEQCKGIGRKASGNSTTNVPPPPPLPLFLPPASPKPVSDYPLGAYPSVTSPPCPY